MNELNYGKIPIKSWCGKPEEGAIDQARELSNHYAAFHHVALMPDTHQGYAIPIGGVVAFKDVICPAGVGYDIACGMLVAKINVGRGDLNKEVLKTVVHDIKRTIPMGFNHQKDAKKWKKEAKELIEKYPNLDEDLVTREAVANQLGTLGGGNHFIEFQKDEKGKIWLMIHSGSRNIGHTVATHFNRLAKKLPSRGAHSTGLDVLDINSTEGQDYLMHMNFCVDFSFKNRECMLVDCINVLNKHVPSVHVGYSKMVNIHHNYANLETHFDEEVWVHRKGATSAKAGELGIIPGSMGDNSYMVEGLGNPESFESCSHGAGRRMSRKRAKEILRLDDFKKKMGEIVSEDLNRNHIDESPMAYKDISTVMSEQTDLVKIVHTFTPIANMKG